MGGGCGWAGECRDQTAECVYRRSRVPILVGEARAVGIQLPSSFYREVLTASTSSRANRARGSLGSLDLEWPEWGVTSGRILGGLATRGGPTTTRGMRGNTPLVGEAVWKAACAREDTPESRSARLRTTIFYV